MIEELTTYDLIRLRHCLSEKLIHGNGDLYAYRKLFLKLTKILEAELSKTK